MIKFARNILTIEALNDIITIVRTSNSHHAEVAELADALDSKSSAFKRAGSSPAFGTTSINALPEVFRKVRFFSHFNFDSLFDSRPY